MLDSGLWHFLAKAGIISAFPLGLEEGEMRMIPQQTVGCGANGARPQREAAPGMSPSPAHAGTDARAEADLPQAGKELPSRLAGAGRAARSVCARRGGGSWALGRCDGADSSEFRLASWDFCASGQRCLNLFTYQSALVVWGPGNQAKRICTCSQCRKNNAVI